MSVDPRHHRHFVSRKADVVRQIADECGGVSIVFPRVGSKSDKVVLKGAKQCVDTARQRILDMVADLVCVHIAAATGATTNFTPGHIPPIGQFPCDFFTSHFLDPADLTVSFFCCTFCNSFICRIPRLSVGFYFRQKTSIVNYYVVCNAC